jgi:hypothetical protein
MENYRILGPLVLSMREAPRQNFAQAKLVEVLILFIWIYFLFIWGVVPEILFLGAIILAASKIIPSWISGETHETFALTNGTNTKRAEPKILLGAVSLAMRSVVALLLLFATIQIAYDLVSSPPA